VSLFSPIELKPRTRSPDRDRRAPRRIGTGAPRLVESSADRRAIADRMSWEALLDVVRRSAQARLDLLQNRASSDEMKCPWARLVACDVNCRCRGMKIVTVGFLRDHYERLALEIVIATTPWRVGGSA
jgi:hypothetical protein